MPSPDDLSVAFARLGLLGQNPDVNIRPVLLRVVVDLFLQKTHHAPADLKLFEAMVTPMLDQLDPAGRRLLIDKLFSHPATPRSLLDRLMDDQGLIETEVFRHATLPDTELLATARDGTALMAATVAQRSALPPTVLAALMSRPEDRIAIALVENRDVRLSGADLRRLVERARANPELAEILAARASDPLALAPLFPTLSPVGRRHVIDTLRRHHLGRRRWGRPDGATAAVIDKLDRLVLSGEWEGFDLGLCVAMACDHRLLRPLLHDGQGDVLALALAAVGASADMAARAFILGDPAIGRSVGAVRRLTAVVDTVAPDAGRRMVLAMLDGQEVTPRRPATVRVPAGSSRRLDAGAEVATGRRDVAEAPRRSIA